MQECEDWNSHYHDHSSSRKKGCGKLASFISTWWHRLQRRRHLEAQRNRDSIGFFSNHIKYIEQNFGSGVSTFFYQWRRILLIDLAIFIIWFCLTIIFWLMKPPQNSYFHSQPTPLNETFWERDDFSAGKMVSLFGGEENTFMTDSFFFTSGYPATWTWNEYDLSGTTVTYMMDSAFAGAILASFFTFLFVITQGMIANFLGNAVDAVVQNYIKEKGEEEHVVVDTDQAFCTALLGSFDHGCCSASAGHEVVQHMVTSIQLKLITLFRGLDIKMGFSVKLGCLLEYKPAANGPTFQVHVCFGAKRAYNVACEDELPKNHEAMELRQTALDKTKNQLRHELPGNHKERDEKLWKMLQQNPNLFHRNVEKTVRKIVQEIRVQPDNIPDYGDAFISHDVYVAFVATKDNGARRQLASREQLQKYLGTRDIDAAKLQVFKYGTPVNASSRHERDQACPLENASSGGLVQRFINNQKWGQSSHEEDISFGYFEVVAKSKNADKVTTDLERIRESVFKGMGGVHKWQQYVDGSACDGELDDQTQEMNLIEFGFPLETMEEIKNTLFFNMVFKSYGQGCEDMVYSGYQPQLKLVNTDLGGREILAPEQGSSGDQALKQELISATKTSSDMLSAVYILLLGEQDKRPVKQFFLNLQRREALEKPEVDKHGFLGLTPKKRRAISHSVYEHGVFSYEAIASLQEAKKTEHKPTFTYVMPISKALLEEPLGSLKTAIGVALTLLLMGITIASVVAIVKFEKDLKDKTGSSLVVPVILFMIKTIIPQVVKVVTKMEDWGDPEFEIQLTMYRTYLLKMANIGILYHQLNSGNLESNKCSEAVAGQMFYQLIVTNSICTSVSNFAMYGFFKAVWGKSEVDGPIVAQLYVDLNYNQALFFMGLTYVPILPVWFFLMSCIEFWVLYMCLRHFCSFAERPFEVRDKNSTLWFLIVTWAICAAFCAEFLTTAPTSTIPCGPWAPGEIRYLALSKFFDRDMPTFLTDIMRFLLNPMLVYSLVVILVVWIMFEAAALSAVRDQCAESAWRVTTLTRHVQSLMKSKTQRDRMTKQEADMQSQELTEAMATKRRYRDERDEARRQLEAANARIQELQRN